MGCGSSKPKAGSMRIELDDYDISKPS